MEIVDPADGASHGHGWLQRLGLEARPPGPDSWVPVARGFHLDDGDADSSTDAGRLIDRLGRVGINGRQWAYQFTQIDTSHFHRLGAVASGQSVTRVAVLVPNRDLHRAIAIAKQAEREQRQAPPPQPPVSEQQLTREALADPAPDDLTA